MKQIIYTLAVLLLTISEAKAQQATPNDQLLTGVWEQKGTLMGEGESAYVLPHKHREGCEKDHTSFEADYSGSEVRFNPECEARERNFNWKLEGDQLILTSGERTMEWHLKSLDATTMTVGIPMRPGSENRMYVVYDKQEN